MNLRLTLATIAALATTVVNVEAASARVHHGVHRTLQQSGKVNIVVKMAAKPTEALDTFESMSFATRGDKLQTLKSKLDAHSVSSQADIDAILAKESSTAQPLFESQHRSWISNARFFNGATLELVEKLAAVPGVAVIREQVVAELHESSVDADTIQWGVDKIQSTKVWADGTIGQKVVVATIDTGARYTHTLLKSNMRETHNWFDPVSGTALPLDDNGHGTHVMGTIAGSRGYGVAPGAKWMACRGCPAGSCPEDVLTKCAEFMLCPTDPKGDNQDCSKAPHVINNSWGSPGGNDWYQDAVDTWQKAGIIPVFSLGNDGPKCATAGSPGDYGNVIGVGATSLNETLAYFSDRGPAVSGLMKPDISAPGLSIISSYNTSDTALALSSGTSMAAPHVTGAIALLLSKEPDLKYKDIYMRLTSTADQGPFNATLSTGYGGSDACGGTKETVFPNNHYGYGRLNVFSAYQGFRQTVPSTPATTTKAPSTPAPTTKSPTPAPTPAPTTVSFCAKWQDKSSCQVWFWCSWNGNAKTCS